MPTQTAEMPFNNPRDDTALTCPSPMVSDAYGSPIDQELMQIFTDDDINTHLATQIAVGHINPTTREGYEDGAAKALVALQCGSCALRAECGVTRELTKLTQHLEKASILEQLVDESPKWLTNARVGSLGLSREDAINLLRNPSRLTALVKEGALTTEDFRAGISSTRQSDIAKDEIPGVRNLSFVDDIPYRRDLLTTDRGDQFTVIDVSEGTNYDASRLGPGYEEILLSKLLKQICEVDSAGRPHIYTNDTKRQSNIGNADLGDDVNVIEIKKPGTKVRVYCTVKRSPTEPTTIVILAYQGGGNDTTQNNIIKQFKAS